MTNDHTGNDEALLKIEGSLSSTFCHLKPSRYRSFECSSRINYSAYEEEEREEVSHAARHNINYVKLHFGFINL